MATVGAPGTPGMTPTILRQIMTTDALHRIRGLGQAIDVDRQAPHLMAQQLEALNDTLTSIDHAWYGDRCGAQENRIKVNQAMILNTVVYQQFDRQIRGADRRANADTFNRVMHARPRRCRGQWWECANAETCRSTPTSAPWQGDGVLLP